MSDAIDPIIAIFNQALQFAPPYRCAYLNGACGANSELRQQVEALLNAYEQSGEFLVDSVAILHGGVAPQHSAGEGVGDRVGPYRLVQQIGEGGCGIVFMAEQVEPIRRRVALKLIKPGMDSRSVIARFEAERQALALMDHPNIAKVFDAGVTPSGRPYFVMELIRGCRITDYCDQNSLGTVERLQLFAQVCQAVQHAHHKGVIHRDIKPSNILVARAESGATLPVVIDFGVAKAITNQPLTDKTLFTAYEMLIGTPAYMSPEQAALANVDVDTRSDVYSLGVLLYELLTGCTPFDTAQLLKSGLDEVRRAIREQDPDRPSTRLSRMTNAELARVARVRQAEPPGLIKTVHGDLDWIVMRALEKDRTRRYETPSDLASDVMRFLANEPIAARPPGRFYQFKKTVQRNRLLFAAIGVISALLFVSLILVSAALTKERRALQQAKQNETKAQTEAAKSAQVTRFLEEMLEGVGPSVALGQDTEMLRGILDRTAGRLGKEMTNQPAVEAELRGVIGRLYLEIGKLEPARMMHLAELNLRRQVSGPHSEETAAALNNLGDVYFKERQIAEAEAAYSEALAIRRRLFGNEHLQVAATLNGLGTVYRRQRKLEEAEMLTREALGIRRRLIGEKSLEIAESLRNLSIILAERRQAEEAEKSGRQMLAMRRELLGSDHPAVAAALVDLAWIQGFTDKKSEAEAMETEAFLIQRKVLGDEHPEVARSIYLMGGRLRDRGDLLASQGMLAAAISIQRKLLGPTHPDVLASLRTYGATLERQGKWAEAETVYREGLESWQRRAGNSDYETLKAADNLAEALIKQRKYAEAERLLDDLLTSTNRARPESASLLMRRLEILGRQKRWPQAVDDAARIVEHRPDDHYRYHQLAGLLAITGNRSAYEQLCKEVLAKFGETKDPHIAERVASDCLLLPNSGVDLNAVDQLAARSVELGHKHGGLPYFMACKALSEYRLGNHLLALKWADKSSAGGEELAGAKAHAVAAMALARLKRRDEATARLSEANRLAPKDFGAATNDMGSSWLAWMFARVAVDEAAAVLESMSVTSSSTP